MFIYTTSETANATIESVWAHYEAVRHWHRWDQSVEEAALQGDFQVGTVGEMKTFGMPTISFELTEVTKHQSFSNTSRLGPFTVTFAHNIVANGEMVTVEHGVVVDGPDEQQVQSIGQTIAATIPAAIHQLLEQSK